MANQQEDIRHFKALRRQCLGQITDLENNVRTIGAKTQRFSPEAREQEIVRLRYSMTSYENWLRNNGVEFGD